MAGKHWKVVGGGDKGGILVREGLALGSRELDERLATGAIVEEERLEGERLSFRKVAGAGPLHGWVSLRVKDKDLVVPHDLSEASEAAAEAEAEDAPAASEGTLASTAAASAASESPQERRLRALEAAERRQASMPGVSEKKRAELLEGRAKEELLRKLTDHYGRIGEELPLGLRAASAEQLRRHWEGLGKEEQSGQREEEQRRRREEEQRRRREEEQRRQREEEQRRQRDEEERRRKEEEERRRREEEQTRQREAEHRRRREEEERRRALEIQRRTPRSRLMCASPGCHMTVHSRPELGGYCCIACSEGGEHGPRCEQIMAPADAVKADPNWVTMGGDQLEDMELEEALQLSMLEASGVPVAGPPGAAPGDGRPGGRGLPPPGAQPGGGRSGKTQEELDLEEAMRLSMLEAAPEEAPELDDEARELEEAMRLSMLVAAPEELDKPAAPAGRPQGGDASDEDEDDDDDEVPDLIPIEQK